MKHFRVPVSKLVEIILHVRKGAKYGVKKMNSGQTICSRDSSVGNGKHFEKQAQSSKVEYYAMDIFNAIDKFNNEEIPLTTTVIRRYCIVVVCYLLFIY